MAIMLRCCEGCNTWHETDELKVHLKCEKCRGEN